MEIHHAHEPWNKGKLVGQKPPLKPKDIWAIRYNLQNAHHVRDLAMFNLAIDSKLRGGDLVNLRVRDVMHADQILSRAMVVQRKTQRPVQFKLTEPTRSAVAAWIEKSNLKAEHYLFPSRLANSPHISTRQLYRSQATREFPVPARTPDEKLIDVSRRCRRHRYRPPRRRRRRRCRGTGQAP